MAGNCCSTSLQGSSFVIPACPTGELIIMTDEAKSYGVLNTDCNTVALSPTATQIMTDAFQLYPLTVDQLARLYGCDAEALVADLSDDRIIALSPTAPPKDQSTQYPVQAGDPINPTGATPVIAQYAGLVYCFKIGPVWVYIYLSAVPLSTATNGNAVPNGTYAVGDFGELGRTLYPIQAQSALGANCNVCGACGGCGACGACVLCGEINFGVGAIALVAVDAALAVTSALNSFTAHMPNNP